MGPGGPQEHECWGEVEGSSLLGGSVVAFKSNCMRMNAPEGCKGNGPPQR